ILAAGLSSITQKNWMPYLAALMNEEEIPVPIMAATLRLAKAYGQPMDSAQLIARHFATLEKLPTAQVMTGVGDMLEAIERSESSLKKLLQRTGDKDLDKTLDKLKDVHVEAVNVMQNPKHTIRERILALRLMAQGLGDDRKDDKLLLGLLTPQTPEELQSAVV